MLEDRLWCALSKMVMGTGLAAVSYWAATHVVTGGGGGFADFWLGCFSAVTAVAAAALIVIGLVEMYGDCDGHHY